MTRGPDDSEEDLGRPIEELAQLREEPARGFLRRVRGRIYRKVLVNQVTDYLWFTPLLVMLEYLKMIVELFGGDHEERET